MSYLEHLTDKADDDDDDDDDDMMIKSYCQSMVSNVRFAGDIDLIQKT